MVIVRNQNLQQAPPQDNFAGQNGDPREAENDLNKAQTDEERQEPDSESNYGTAEPLANQDTLNEENTGQLW